MSVSDLRDACVIPQIFPLSFLGGSCFTTRLSALMIQLR